MRPAGVWKFSVGWEGKNDRNPAGFFGLEDISRDLQLLSGAENNRVLREATRAGANVLKEEVVSRAPVRRENCAAMWWSFPGAPAMAG